jgi:hypothetical protein
MKSSLRAFEQIQDHLVECARKLFNAYGLEISHVQDGAPMHSRPELCIAGILGYGSTGLRGCVVVAGAAEVFAHAMPPELVDGNPSEACLRDLAGEFANMLLGAVKGKLLGNGIVIQLACPITAIGSAMSLVAPSGGTSTLHTFSSAHGPLHVRFDAQFDADFEFGEALADSATMETGESILF